LSARCISRHWAEGFDLARAACDNAALADSRGYDVSKQLTEGQRAYEARRAAKAGVSLEKWLAQKEKQAQADAAAQRKAAEPPKPAKKPGFFARLLEKAQKPL